MNKKYGIVLAVVGVFVIIAGWFLFSTPRAEAPSSGAPAGDTSLPIVSTASNQVVAPLPATVEYSANGFSPSTITIKQGDVVTFVSKDDTPMWVASAMHPTHIEYSGTSREEHCPDTLGVSFDQCETGSVYTFKFLKTGTWKYHNHVRGGAYGVVIVQ